MFALMISRSSLKMVTWGQKLDDQVKSKEILVYTLEVTFLAHLSYAQDELLCSLFIRPCIHSSIR